MNKEERKAIEDMNRFANGDDMSSVTAKEMQTILNLIEKLQKENEEYSKQIDLDYVNDNYIAKQKIKDKMEQLNKEMKISDVTDAIFKIKQQQILQELIEEEEK